MALSFGGEAVSDARVVSRPTTVDAPSSAPAKLYGASKVTRMVCCVLWCFCWSSSRPLSAVSACLSLGGVAVRGSAGGSDDAPAWSGSGAPRSLARHAWPSGSVAASASVAVVDVVLGAGHCACGQAKVSINAGHCWCAAVVVDLAVVWRGRPVGVVPPEVTACAGARG